MVLMAYGTPTYQSPPPAVAYGSWLQRVAAYLLDGVITGVPLLIGVALASAVGGGTGMALYLLLALVSLVIHIYNRWIMAGRTGQSWGKKVVGLRLIAEQTGQPIGAGMAFVRDLAHIVDGVICYVGYLFPLWDVKRQTIADKMLSTVVVTV